MKLKDFVRKYQMCSNAKVVLVICPSGKRRVLAEDWLRDVDLGGLSTFTIQSFSVIDNTLSIYVTASGR